MPKHLLLFSGLGESNIPNLTEGFPLLKDTSKKNEVTIVLLTIKTIVEHNLICISNALIPVK